MLFTVSKRHYPDALLDRLIFWLDLHTAVNEDEDGYTFAVDESFHLRLMHYLSQIGLPADCLREVADNAAVSSDTEEKTDEHL